MGGELTSNGRRGLFVTFLIPLAIKAAGTTRTEP